MEQNYKNKIYLATIGVLLFCFAVLFIWQKFFPVVEPGHRLAMIGDKTLTLEIAANQEQKIKGLSGREILPEDQGMYFPYDDYDYRHFWMAEMGFPLDIIWLKDKVVVGLVEAVLPVPITANTNEDDIPRISSLEPVNGVLEVNAGFVKKNQIRVGDQLIFLDN